MNNDRREFLKKGLLGVSAAALIPGVIKGSPVASSTAASPADLPSRVLGRTGIQAPLISLGASGAINRDFVKGAYNSGIKLFFSATYYGEGNNEIIVGEALKGLPRDSFVVATAAPCNDIDNRTGLLNDKFSARAYMEKAEGSLRRFGLDHIDIILFPYAAKRETVCNEDILRTMEQLRQQGKVRFTGIASHNGTEEALDAAASTGIYDIAMISYNFRIQSREALDAAIARATASGMGIVAMKTTAGVFRNKSGPGINSDAALKWALQNANISTIVSGMTTSEQIQKNLAMIRNLKMTGEEMADLGRALAFSDTGLFCQQCGQCLSQCPASLDIPTIMRGYMYAYGYRNLRQARNTLAAASLKKGPCADCNSCSVKCRSGFDVRGKIQDIARLTEMPEDFLLS
ncbi:MAG: aldo/keto reductase [Bacteroidales bacterium]|nr:aldo/keto reductase [Bacteroidales bacterium]